MQEPWSSGYGRRLMFQRLWVWIPALCTGWSFFHIPICCKICNVCLKRQKIMNKRPKLVHLKKSSVARKKWFFTKVDLWIFSSNFQFCTNGGMPFPFRENVCQFFPFHWRWRRKYSLDRKEKMQIWLSTKRLHQALIGLMCR